MCFKLLPAFIKRTRLAVGSVSFWWTIRKERFEKWELLQFYSPSWLLFQQIPSLNKMKSWFVTWMAVWNADKSADVALKAAHRPTVSSLQQTAPVLDQIATVMLTECSSSPPPIQQPSTNATRLSALTEAMDLKSLNARAHATPTSAMRNKLASSPRIGFLTAMPLPTHHHPQECAFVNAPPANRSKLWTKEISAIIILNQSIKNNFKLNCKRKQFSFVTYFNSSQDCLIPKKIIEHIKCLKALRVASKFQLTFGTLF